MSEVYTSWEECYQISREDFIDRYKIEPSKEEVEDHMEFLCERYRY